MKYSALGIPALLFVGILLVSCSQQEDPTKPAPIKTYVTEKVSNSLTHFHAQCALDQEG
jgi:hypothetical protein